MHALQTLLVRGVPLAAGLVAIVALAEPTDAVRAQLLLKTLGYDRHLTAGSGPFAVGVVGPEGPRSALVRELGRAVPPPIKGHPVTAVDCGEAGVCESTPPQALLLLPGLSAAVLKTLTAAAHRAGRYTLALDVEQVTAGAMIGLSADNRAVLNGEALSAAAVDFEPALARRAQLIGKLAQEETAIELPERAVPPTELGGNARPQYPPTALEEEREAEVVLRVIVRADGEVGAVRVLEGDRLFADPTVASVRGWHWRPATLDGKPIAVYRVIRVPFRIQ